MYARLQDLEMLKARKQKGSLNSTQSVDKSRMNNKRYMILTYVVEFDKVHYPLPLNYEVIVWMIHALTNEKT